MKLTAWRRQESSHSELLQSHQDPKISLWKFIVIIIKKKNEKKKKEREPLILNLPTERPPNVRPLNVG